MRKVRGRHEAKTAKTKWGTHYSPGVNRAARFGVETDDGPGQDRKRQDPNSEKKGGEKA